MHSSLLILVVVGTVSLVSARIPVSTIEKDAAEITGLMHDAKKLSPLVARQYLESTCQALAECFPGSPSFDKLMRKLARLANECPDSAHSSDCRQFENCAPIRNLSQLSNDPQLLKYASMVATKMSRDTSKMQSTLDHCSQEEIHSMICQWDAVDEYRSCTRKFLTHLAGETQSKMYKTHSENLKQAYHDIIDELNKDL